MARSDREKRLIRRWLPDYNSSLGRAYEIRAWPDDDSSRQAVDAIATDPRHGDLAIEHTLLQPFQTERADSNVFMRTIGQLDQAKDLLVDDFTVTLSVDVGAVPKGVPWDQVATAVRDWYRARFPEMPTGRSRQRVSGLPFELLVDVDKAATIGDAFFFTDRRMPQETVEPVVEQALSAKLPKLSAAEAPRRTLLLEKGSIPRGYAEIGAAIEALRGRFPQLAGVDDIWVVNTVAWETHDYAPSALVWPPEAALDWDRRRHGGAQEV